MLAGLLTGLGSKAIGWLIGGSAVLLTVGLLWLGNHEKSLQIDSLTAANAMRDQQLDQAAEVNAQAAAEYDKLKAEQARQQQIAATARQQAKAALAYADQLKTEIARAPSSDDGMVSPLLRRTLDSLRQHLAGAAAPAGPAEAGKATGRPQPLGVR